MDAKELAGRVRSIDFRALGMYSREVLGALILVAFGVFFVRFIYGGVAASIRSTQAQITTARSELDIIDAETRALPTIKKNFSETTARLAVAEKRLKSIRERLPAEKQISAILADISGGNGGGVRVTSVRPMPPEDRGELTRLPFQLTIEGRYVPFGNYVERIENLPRVMAVDNMKVEARDSGSPALTTQLFLSAYVYGEARP